MRRHLVLGVLVGAIFGGWDLIATRFEPLADDTPIALLKFYGPMFTIWGLAGFGAAWRVGRILDGVKAGATVAFATFLVFDVANLLRVNLFSMPSAVERTGRILFCDFMRVASRASERSPTTTT
jgi:hypothetical protein